MNADTAAMSRAGLGQGGSATLIFAAAALLVLSPIVLSSSWVGADYPNHLARMAILARDGTADPHPFYVARWGLYPNLAMDLLVPPFARLIGPDAATRAFFLTSALLVLSGAMALGQMAGRRPLQSGVAALLILHSLPFALGFLNYEFALGLAFWAIAGWIALADRPWTLRFAVHVAAVVALAAGHLVALGIYGFAIGLIEIWNLRSGRLGWAALLLRFAWMALPAFGIALLLGTGGQVGGEGLLWGVSHKPIWLMALGGFDPRASILAATALAALLYVLGRSGRLRLEGPGPLLAIGFGLLYVALPFRLLDTAYADTRIVAAGIVIVTAFLRIDLDDPRWRQATLAVVSLAGAIVLGSVAWAQHQLGFDRREIEASFSALGRRARVLVATSHEPLVFDNALAHVPTLAAARTDAFVASVFTHPGKQPVRPVPALRSLASDNGVVLPIHVLSMLAAGEAPPRTAEFAARWTNDFDYLYVVGPPVPDLLPAFLVPVSSGRAFTLYKIRPGGAAR